VDEVLREAAIGNTAALQALETIGGWLGTGLADLVNIFNPQRLVLGGMFAKAHPYLSDAVRRELDERVQSPSRAMVTVAPTTLGDDSTLIGAVELAFEPLLADPAALAPARGSAAGGSPSLGQGPNDQSAARKLSHWPSPTEP
jgi:predicted NBD/HSP70 family sugar kinase